MITAAVLLAPVQTHRISMLFNLRPMWDEHQTWELIIPVALPILPPLDGSTALASPLSCGR